MHAFAFLFFSPGPLPIRHMTHHDDSVPAALNPSKHTYNRLLHTNTNQTGRQAHPPPASSMTPAPKSPPPAREHPAAAAGAGERRCDPGREAAVGPAATPGVGRGDGGVRSRRRKRAPGVVVGLRERVHVDLPAAFFGTDGRRLLQCVRGGRQRRGGGGGGRTPRRLL